MGRGAGCGPLYRKGDSRVQGCAMRAGEVDFIMGSDTLDANSYLELSQVEGITGVISDFNFVTEFIALNDEVAPLDDLNVRTAIQMAIDKESIAQNIYPVCVQRRIR